MEMTSTKSICLRYILDQHTHAQMMARRPERKQRQKGNIALSSLLSHLEVGACFSYMFVHPDRC